MKLLLIHCDEIRVEPIKKAIDVADKPVSLEASNALVVFTAVEKHDFAGMLPEIAHDVQSVAERVKASQIVVYPFVHLTNNPARPEIARAISSTLASLLGAKQAPFGWYKRLTIRKKAHPLSELSRTYPRTKSVEFDQYEFVVKSLLDKYIFNYTIDTSVVRKMNFSYKRIPFISTGGVVGLDGIRMVISRVRSLVDVDLFVGEELCSKFSDAKCLPTNTIELRFKSRTLASFHVDSVKYFDKRGKSVKDYFFVPVVDYDLLTKVVKRDFWLKPVQVLVCSVSKNYVDKSVEVAEQICARTLVDDRNLRLERKVYEAESKGIPIIIAVGDYIGVRIDGKVRKWSVEQVNNYVKEKMNSYPYVPRNWPLLLTKHPRIS